MQLQTGEEQLLKAVLWFANSDFTKTEDVEKNLLSGVPERWRGPRFQRIPAIDIDAFRNDQRELRQWLDAIIANRVTADIAKAMTKRFTETVHVSVRFESRRGRPVPIAEYVLDGVQATYALAISFLTADELRSRLHRCQLRPGKTSNKEIEVCDDFFLSVRTGKGRQRTDFCCTEHANANKVRQFRDRNRSSKRKAS